MYDEKALYLLEPLVRHLAKDDQPLIGPVLLVLERYLHLTENVEINDGHMGMQIFFVGLWQAASTISSRWPSARAQTVCEEFEERLWGSPLMALCELLGEVSLEEDFRKMSGSPSDDRFFCEALNMGFVSLSLVTDWIFAIDFNDLSVRMIHNTRGRWAGILDYKISAPKGGQDLLMPVRNVLEHHWILTHFKSE
ncbi:hypothetical protein F5Y13DRAFT_165463 [Hypoxylon sp. FL1857]|nr:hypothetical protein F5Y13DRAFT_165463 [Hypoxylon sp. FL1857]